VFRSLPGWYTKSYSFRFHVNVGFTRCGVRILLNKIIPQSIYNCVVFGISQLLPFKSLRKSTRIKKKRKKGALRERLMFLTNMLLGSGGEMPIKDV